MSVVDPVDEKIDAISCPKCDEDAETVLLLECAPECEIVGYTGVQCKACGYIEPSDKERIRRWKGAA